MLERVGRRGLQRVGKLGGLEKEGGGEVLGLEGAEIGNVLHIRSFNCLLQR